MDAQEKGVWVDEIELDIPSIPSEDMDVNLWDLVVWAAFMVLASAAFDDGYQITFCDSSRAQEVFLVQVSPGSDLVVATSECLDSLILRDLEP